MNEPFIPSALREDYTQDGQEKNGYVNILERIQNNERTHWDSILNEVEEDARDLRNLPHPSIPEEMFRKIYLPMFAGVEEEKRVIKVDYHSWMGVSGDHRTPVDVVDTQGKVLFTVPPIFPDTTQSLKIQPPARDGRSFQMVQQYAGEVARNFPQQGAVVLQAGREALMPKTELTQVEEYMLLWAPMLGFYGFLEHVEPTIDVHYTLYGYSKYKGAKGKTTQTTIKTEDVDDMLDWD